MIKENKNAEIQFLINYMEAFETGIPYTSSILNSLDHLSYDIAKRRATRVMVEKCEVIITYLYFASAKNIFIKNLFCCKVKCNNDETFEIKDIKGNVKEIVNNSAGIYSPLQTMPELPPKVETLVITVFSNDRLNVTCPGLDIKIR